MFQKGQSGNPRGRAAELPGLSAQVRKETKDGAELVAFMVGIVRGGIVEYPGTRRRARPTIKQRMQAVEWLAERGFGKVPQPLEHTGAEGGPIEITNAELDERIAAELARIATIGALAFLASDSVAGAETASPVEVARLEG